MFGLLAKIDVKTISDYDDKINKEDRVIRKVKLVHQDEVTRKIYNSGNKQKLAMEVATLLISVTRYSITALASERKDTIDNAPK
jgi:hypothetical protein